MPRSSTNLFPSGFLTKRVIVWKLKGLLQSSICATCHAYFISLDLIITKNILWGVLIMNFLITQCSPASCYFLLFRFKYILQHPTLKHPQPTFFLNVTNFHIPIKQQKDYSSLHYILCNLQKKIETETIQEQTAAGISWNSSASNFIINAIFISQCNLQISGFFHIFRDFISYF